MSVASQGRSFGDKLSAELQGRGMGARTLAKEIAREHGGTVDDRRRTIIRWLRGATPVEANRHLVEDTLGLERDSLKGDDEDEESDAVSFAAFTEFYRALKSEVIQAVRAEAQVVA